MIDNGNSSYAQQSLSVNDIFTPIPRTTSPVSCSVQIRVTDDNNNTECDDDNDSCFTEDETNDLQFGDMEY